MALAVLHCYADYKWTGPSEPVAALCRELCRLGWRAELACAGARGNNERTLPAQARAMGLTVHDEFQFDGRSSLTGTVRDVKRLSRLVKAGEFRIVHVHGTWDHMLTAFALGRRPRPVPIIRSDHRGRMRRNSQLERLEFGPRMTDHLTVLADCLRVRAVDRFGMAPETVTTVRGAVDARGFEPAQPPPGIRQRFGLCDQDVVIGVVSRVQRHRRFEVLLEAAQRVRRSDPRVKIAVLGRGTSKQVILDEPLKRLGLQGTVCPLGYHVEGYREVMAMFDAGLMLVPGSDGSCRAALQMAAMGKPLVVAERGVLPDIVRDGETGLVVRDTPENLTDAILEMAQSPERRRQWGSAARERMVEHFSPEGQAQAVAALYQKMLDT